MRKRVILPAAMTFLALAPAASADLRVGTAKDPVGDAQVAGVGFPQAKDLTQADVRYNRAAGDIVVEATMAGDIPSFGRHYSMLFYVTLRARTATGCDGEQRVEITGDNGSGVPGARWERFPQVTEPGTSMLISGGNGYARFSGRRISFRANGQPTVPYVNGHGTVLQNLDLACATIDVRSGPTCDLFYGTCTLGSLFDRLDVPVSLGPPAPPVVKRTPRVTVRSDRTRDGRRPFRYRVSGKVTPPSGRTAAACSGGVFLSLKRGPVTVGATTVKLRSNCTFAKTLSVIGSAKLPKRGRLKLGARFAGNELLNAKSASSRIVRYGPR